jgi:DNA-binding SARP family transcriptional activator/Tfp pilus assembly protein PilF
VLGSLEVASEAGALELGGPRLRAVLALLISAAGRTVSLSSLVDELWRENAPPDADRTVRTYVSRLRRALAPVDGPDGELIVTRPPGYLLRIHPDAVDAARFERLAAAGRQALELGRPATAGDRLREALALWRDTAYAEFGDVVALAAESARLEQGRRTALQDRIDADLAAGRGADLVPELEGLVVQYPGHERLWGQLMTALYRSGRQTEALAAYRRARVVLIEESGVEPSPSLVELHQRILAQDGDLLSPVAASPATVPAPAVRPAQLPLAVRGFTGREAELGALDAALPTPDADHGGPAVRIICGTAGVGKTTLAVHWAHRVADRFPDGQLYVNLRGFAPTGSALDPAEAVRGFLAALGVPADGVPPGLPAQTGLFRSLLAGRRMLVVLDNARDAEQVRPLLPGAAGCVALVTSRSQLTSLVVNEGAEVLTLGLLPDAAAGELLARRLGSTRIAAEADAVAEIIDRCAGLPLALAIVAARAVSQPAFTLASLAAGLRHPGALPAHGLDAFDAGDEATDVRSVFSWSYRTLTATAARLFRLLGLHPGPDVTLAAAASLTGHPAAHSRRALTELTRANLLTEHEPGRYTSHDLLRAYAADLAHAEDAEADRRAAVRRLLDHYLHTADAAALALYRNRDQLDLDPPVGGVIVDDLPDRPAALRWFRAECAALLAAASLAATAGFDTHAWQLPWTLVALLDGQGQWDDIILTQRTALAVATRLGLTRVQGDAHRFMAGACLRMGRHAEAHEQLAAALEYYVAAGEALGQAHTHHYFAMLLTQEGRNAVALDHAYRSLELYRTAGHRAGQAMAHNAVGWYLGHLGEYAEALVYCTRALELHRELGDQASEGETLDSIAYVHHHLGNFEQAVACYQDALALHRQFGERYPEAITLAHLGDTYEEAGDLVAAAQARRMALGIFEDLGHGPVRELRDKIVAAPVPAGARKMN